MKLILIYKNFFASCLDLAGDTEWMAAECDQYVDGIQEIVPNFRPIGMAFLSGSKEQLVC